MKIKTMSHCQGKGSLSHNNRLFKPKNVDETRTADNITFIKESIAEAYQKLFGAAVERYNAKQKRADRRITTSYFEYAFNHAPSNNVITSPDKRNSFYEDLVQIGDKDDSGCGTPDGKLVAECLTEYMHGFAERNPNFYVFNSILHVDEATPHLHIDYIPVGHYSRGVDTQNGLAQALKEMGFTGIEAISKWRESERRVLEKICNAHGIEIKETEKSRGSFAVEEYKEYKENLTEIQNETAQKTAELEKVAQKKADVKALENIEAKHIPFTQSVAVKKDDYENLQTLAQKQVAVVKSTKKLKAENADLKKQNETLTAKVAELSQRNEKTVHLKIENGELQKKINGLEKTLALIMGFIERLGLREKLEAFLHPERKRALGRSDDATL